MDLTSLFNVQNVLQAVGVGVIIYCLRSWFETKWSALINNKIWRGCVLPTAALVVSLAISLLLPTAGPMALRDTILNSLFAGFFSSYAFSFLKGSLSKGAND